MINTVRTPLKITARNRSQNFFFLSLLLILLTVTRASAQPRLDSLLAPGNLINAYFCDLDSDSISEAMLFFIDEGNESAKRKMAFHRMVGERYDAKPEQVLEIDKEAVCFDFADVDGDSLIDLLLCGTGGIVAHRFNGSRFDLNPRRLLETQTIFNISPDYEIVHWELIQYLSEKSGAILFVPTPTGFNLYRVEQSGIIFSQAIEYRHRMTLEKKPAYHNYDYSGMTLTCRLPSIAYGKYDADPMMDIFILDDRLVNIYRGNFDGSFSTRPVQTFGQKLLTSEEDRSGQASLSFKIIDLNSDGLSDIVATKNAGTSISYNTTVSIYKARQLGGYGSSCDRQFVMANGASSPIIGDFNGDGMPDLALPSFKLGVMSTLKILLMKQVEIHLKIFFRGADGDFQEKHGYEKNFSFEVLPGEEIDYANIMLFDGDYDGDGNLDLLIHDGDGRLKVFSRSAGGGFSGGSMLEIRLPRPNGLSARDLNGDRKNEIIAYYTDNAEDQKKIRFVWVD